MTQEVIVSIGEHLRKQCELNYKQTVLQTNVLSDLSNVVLY